jgi:hypothetical protein
MTDTSPTGYLKVSVTSGGEAYPVEGAIVLIKDGGTFGGEGGVIYSLRTDVSGQTVTVPLQTKDGALSVSPGNDSPFALYNAEVIKDGYYRSYVNEIRAFENVTATLPVNLVPQGAGDLPYRSPGMKAGVS